MGSMKSDRNGYKMQKPEERRLTGKKKKPEERRLTGKKKKPERGLDMEKKNLFRIGDVARMFHISVSSLRHYENIGLLRPEYISGESGYRYYSLEQFEVLNTIRYLRALDMPLSEIENFLKNRNIENIEEILRQQKAIVVQKQQEL